MRAESLIILLHHFILTKNSKLMCKCAWGMYMYKNPNHNPKTGSNLTSISFRSDLNLHFHVRLIVLESTYEYNAKWNFIWCLKIWYDHYFRSSDSIDLTTYSEKSWSYVLQDCFTLITLKQKSEENQNF